VIKFPGNDWPRRAATKLTVTINIWGVAKPLVIAADVSKGGHICISLAK
jgi:hypothetical protein